MDWFIIVGIIGAIFLAITVLFDGILDFMHLNFFDNGMFNMTGVAASVSFFGLIGYFVNYYQHNTIVAILSATVVGIIAGLVVGVLTNYLIKSSQDDGYYSEDKMIGSTAKVINGAPTGKYATVPLMMNGVQLYLSAICDEDLQKDDKIRVIKTISPTLVEVEKI